MANTKSAARAERERIAKAERDRVHRIASWSQARNEGIREGLLMAIAAVDGSDECDEFGEYLIVAAKNAVRARGDRHFGDETWQTKRRSE